MNSYPEREARLSGDGWTLARTFLVSWFVVTFGALCIIERTAYRRRADAILDRSLSVKQTASRLGVIASRTSAQKRTAAIVAFAALLYACVRLWRGNRSQEASDVPNPTPDAKDEARIAQGGRASHPEPEGQADEQPLAGSDPDDA